MKTRRDFIRTSSLAAVAATLGLPSAAHAESLLLRGGDPFTPPPRPGDPELRELASRALNAAREAGAAYADVRLTVTRTQSIFFGNPPVETQDVGVGVRALVDGSWGFAAGPDWTLDAVARLGRDAAGQARGNAWAWRVPVELGDPPPPVVADWRTPVKRDPFDVSLEEKTDFIRSAEAHAQTLRNGGATSVVEFERQEKTFASTDGSFVTQTVYTTFGNGSYFVVTAGDRVTNRNGSRAAPFVTPTGAGYEALSESGLIEQIPELYDQARELLTSVPLDAPSRVDVVFDAYAMAAIASATIGQALELDRGLGYEANTVGTSYLAPPETVLGTALAVPAVTITGNRSMPGGASTVMCDDEGVMPRDVAFVTDGAVTDYATTRQLALALAPWYQSRQQPVQSNGCAAAQNGSGIPLVATPNLELRPAPQDQSFLDLVAGVDEGVAILGGGAMMDQQLLNGQGVGEMTYRIRRGKLAGTVSGAGYLFRSPELWKSIVALGGASSAGTRGVSTSKGANQLPFALRASHSVRAVAAHVSNVRLVNATAGVPIPGGG